jgi:hypothetical protein
MIGRQVESSRWHCGFIPSRTSASARAFVQTGAVARLKVGLLLFFCLRLYAATQQAAPEFASRLAAVAPMPALVQAAKANRIPLERIDPSVETNRVCPATPLRRSSRCFPGGPKRNGCYSFKGWSQRLKS